MERKIPEVRWVHERHGALLVQDKDRPVELSAFLFFGSRAELESSKGFAQYLQWEGTPGVVDIFSISTPLGRSFLQVLGDKRSIEFAINFLETADPDQSECFPGLGFDREFGPIILQGLHFDIQGQLERRFDKALEATMYMRTERRLLAAIQRLPQGDFDNEYLKKAFIELLSKK